MIRKDKKGNMITFIKTYENKDLDFSWIKCVNFDDKS